MKTFIITGLFFQHKGPSRVHTLFNGIIKEVDDERGYVGTLTDYYGESDLLNISFGDDLGTEVLTFEKKYDDSPTLITYTLEKSGEMWKGTYSINGGGEEKVKCFLISIDEESFFEWPEDLEIIV